MIGETDSAKDSTTIVKETCMVDLNDGLMRLASGEFVVTRGGEDGKTCGLQFVCRLIVWRRLSASESLCVGMQSSKCRFLDPLLTGVCVVRHQRAKVRLSESSVCELVDTRINEDASLEGPRRSSSPWHLLRASVYFMSAFKLPPQRFTREDQHRKQHHCLPS